MGAVTAIQATNKYVTANYARLYVPKAVLEATVPFQTPVPENPVSSRMYTTAACHLARADV